jgi:hypothetical protein
MNKRLVVVTGPETGRIIPLPNGGALTIGRGAASNTRLNDPRISRVHCKLCVEESGVIISDAGSSGGTMVAGQKIVKQQLSHGDEIRIGDTCLRLETAPPASDKLPAGEPEGGNATRPARQSLQDLVGQTLGHFKLEKIAHVGSTSLLFRGQDLKHSRPAMIKVLLPRVTADEEQRHRFVRAVHTMLNMRHDNLVEVYGAGKQGPFCWCAMELVDGISILEIIELIGTQGRLDWRDVYRIGVHVTRALEYAHRHKIIHRNVTPENLIQRKHDKVVKLCDLLLAKALEGTQSRQVTAPGQLVGNVAYMSPERTVDTSSLDWRSDQYALGATLFALLTGGPPFAAKALPQLVQAVRTEVPSFPADIQQEVNKKFQQIVLKMLAKSPEDRFAFPSQLIDRLDEIGRENDVDADVLYNN